MAEAQSKTKSTAKAESKAAPAVASRDESRRRTLIGVVTSDKMDKTRVVIVERRLAHDKYGKYMTRRAKYKAHDEKNQYKVGDRVLISESRPLSRDKRWTVEKLLDRPQEA